MTCLTLSDFEDTNISLEANFEIFELVSINLLELELQSLLWDTWGLHWKLLSLEITRGKPLYFLNGHFSKIAWIFLEEGHVWHRLNWEISLHDFSINVAAIFPSTLVELQLMSETIYTPFLGCLGNDAIDNLDNHFGVVLHIHNVVAFFHVCLKSVILRGHETWL